MRECPFLWIDVLEVLLDFMLLQNVSAYVQRQEVVGRSGSDWASGLRRITPACGD